MADKDMHERGTENRVEGKTEEAKGKARGAAGDLTDDREQQAKGKAEEAKGSAKDTFGKAQQKLDRKD